MAKLSIRIIPYIFLLVAGNVKGDVTSKLEHVMDQTDTLQSGYSQVFQEGLCRVVMKARGSLVVLKGEEEKKMMWRTGLPPGHKSGDKYKLQLRDRGNMVIERIASSDGPIEAVTVYDTHTEGDVGDYFLGIDDECSLEIHKGTFDKTFPADLLYLQRRQRAVWANIKFDRMGEGESLGVSEIYSYRQWFDHFMFMSPDGNLEIYEGKDFADAGDELLWESDTKRQRGDYRFIIGENATLSLLDVATGEQYWEKVLQNSGRPPSSIDWLSLVSFNGVVKDNSVGPYELFSNSQPYELFGNEGNVFMKQGDILPAGSVYAGDRCNLYVQYDGRLDVDDGWLRPKWSSGKAKDDTISDDYFLMLSDTGNLVMYRKPYFDSPAERLWATHTNGEEGEYFLRMTPRCDLRVYQGTPELRGELVWSSRVTELLPGDRLIKAQYFAPGFAPGVNCDFFMTLLPETGVLGIYDKDSMDKSFYENPESFEDPIWSFDAGLGEYDDFYVKVSYGGKLNFYGVGENGDVLMAEQFDLGEIDGEFKVALCDKDGSSSGSPKSVKIAV
uniref:Bulb-type lectin domain-containing protein n=1 Tax=Helicotheca tamesis TaxID=374047 RepID=A0A6U0GPV3_9STRA